MTGTGIKFSVIIPVFNAAAVIERALESVLAQSYAPHEVIVVDDASRDNTVELIEAKYADRIICIRKLFNSGSSAARNTGMDAATGDYLAFLDADDVWHSDKLSLVNTILTARPEIKFFYHPFSLEPILEKKLPADITVFRLPFVKLLPGNIIATSCAVMRNLPGYRFEPSMRYSEDYDLWLRLGYRNHIFFVTIPLTQIFRLYTTPGGISENRWKMRKGELRAYSRLARLNPFFISLLPFLYLTSLGKHLFRMVFRRS